MEILQVDVGVIPRAPLDSKHWNRGSDIHRRFEFHKTDIIPRSFPLFTVD